MESANRVSSNAFIHNVDTTGLNTPHASQVLSLYMMAAPHTSVFTTLRASSTCFSGLNCKSKSH